MNIRFRLGNFIPPSVFKCHFLTHSTSYSIYVCKSVYVSLPAYQWSSQWRTMTGWSKGKGWGSVRKLIPFNGNNSLQSFSSQRGTILNRKSCLIDTNSHLQLLRVSREHFQAPRICFIIILRIWFNIGILLTVSVDLLVLVECGLSL